MLNIFKISFKDIYAVHVHVCFVFIVLSIETDCQVYIFIISAVYTCIKKPESFSHSGFLLKVARQLPLNTPKNPNRKIQPIYVSKWFFEYSVSKISLIMCQYKRIVQWLTMLLRIIIALKWYVNLQRKHPTASRDVMRITHVLSKLERSCA